MIGCIYRIINTTNNKTYIGSTKDFIERKKRHIRDLKANKHHNIYLQRAFNKENSEESFVFEIVEEIDDLSALLLREKFHIDSKSPEYNIGSVGGGDNLTNNPNREDIIRRIKETVNNNIRNMSVQERKEKWGKSGADNPNFNPNKELRYCSCGKEIQKHNNTCIDCRDISGSKNPFFGHAHSEETNRILSEKAKERYKDGFTTTQFKKTNTPEGIFDSLSQAARHYNVTPGAMHYRVNSCSKKWEEYYYINA